MANPVCEVLLTKTPLRPPDLLPHGSGGIVDFLGAVRPAEGQRAITGITYEAHCDMAAHQMEKIAREAAARFRLDQAMIHHRTGFVAVGEASVFVRTASPHRFEAYRASQWMMDELKKRVPIWKRPQFTQEVGTTWSEAESLTTR